MSSRNYLICWEENNVKQWDMVKEKDNNTFLMNLLQNSDVNKHTIFIIPCCGGFVSGIWLWKNTHKSSRVDFWNFFEEYGTVYKKPVIKEENKQFLHEAHEKKDDGTKYGWISPDGKYFHCGYQGHNSLAYDICFGMVDTDNAERYLEEHGWCKIYKSLFEENYHVYVGGNYVITNAQMKTLIKLGLDDAEDLSKMLCKDRL